MKPQKWILGPLAIAAGLIPQTIPAALAQTATVQPAAAPVAKPAPAANPFLAAAVEEAAPELPTITVWPAQTTTGTRVGPWGNGTAQATAGRTGSTLAVTIRNFEEGVRFDLPKPIDLTPYSQNGFWQIKAQVNGTTGRGGGGRGGRTQGRGGTNTATTPPLTQLKVQFILDKGVLSGIIPLNQQTGGRGGWGGRGGRGGGGQNMLIPVRSLTATPNAQGSVRRIVLTGDSEGSLNVDQVALVSDTNRITAAVRRSTDPEGTDLTTMVVKPGRSTTLMADVNAGTADVNVTWNFNADNSEAFPPASFGQPGMMGGRGGDMGGRGGDTGGRGGAMGGGMPAAMGRPMGTMGGAAAGTQVAAAGRTMAPMAGMTMGGAGGTAMGNMGMMMRRVDATGLTARPDWPNEEQDYRVEVTISDRTGRKPAVKKSITVQVRAGN